MKSGIKNVELLDKEVIEENGRLYLSLKYSYEAKDGTHELYIPRVALNILTKEIPEYRRENNMFYGTDESYILVVKCNYNLKPKAFDEVREYLVNSKAQGVILLPLGFEAIVVPDDVELKFEGTITPESKLPEAYKTCGRCVHDGEMDYDDPRSYCFNCRRNLLVDRRPDYFKEVK